MNRISPSYLYLCLIICLVNLSVTAQNPMQEHYLLNNNNGLSNSAINTIFQDQEGFLWFGTWDGLNKYDGNEFVQYRSHTMQKNTLSHQVIRSVFEEGADLLWITTDYGINRLNKKTNEFKSYFLDYHKNYIYQEKSFYCCINSHGIIVAAFKGSSLYIYDKKKENFYPTKIQGYTSKPHITGLFFDKKDRLWVETTENELLQLEITNEQEFQLLQTIKLPQATRNICYDTDKSIWFTAKEQIYSINVYDLHPKIQVHSLKIEGALNTVLCYQGKTLIGTTNGCFILEKSQLKRYFDIQVSVLSLFIGSQDILWIGTDGKGVYQSFQRPDFITLVLPQRYAQASNFPVRAILKDKNGNIWIGTKGGGLSYITYLGAPGLEKQANYNVGTGRSYNSVMALEEGINCIWVGTDGPGIKYIDLETKKLLSLNLQNFPEAQHIVSVYSIVQADSTTLYIGTSGEGLFKLKLNTKKQVQAIKQYKHNEKDPHSIGSNIVYDIENDSACLWIGTRGGGLNKLNKKTEKFSIWKNDPENSNTICSNDIISLHKCHEQLWIGTTSGLSIFQKDVNGQTHFKHLDESTGLPNTNIHSILEDKDSHIWISTSNGLARINPQSYQTNVYYYEEGLQNNEFSDGAGYVDSSGSELYFGGINCFNIIHPTLMSSKHFKPQLVLKDARLNHTPYLVTNHTINTNYQTGTISLDFAILDYLNNKKCQIAYRLENDSRMLRKKEQPWNYISNNKNIILNELSPGKYTLSVKYSNADQIWYTPIQYSIQIDPPFWMSKWAMLIYIIILIMGVRIFYITKKTRLIMRHELEMEKQEKAKKEEIHQAKLRFFTNIAHEFSNSITLIYGAIEQIFMNENPDEKIKKQLIVIRRNTERMHGQIQELMEFRKAETGHLNIQLEKADIPELVKCTLDNFIDIADSKKISLTYNIQSSVGSWIIDRSMLEKVIFNLLSNAIKYTPSEGYIRLEVSIIDNRLSISCTNSGPGIPQENLENVFNRFTILDNFENKLSEGLYTRNGIGLALCKDLVGLMGGKISVDSILNQYTTFTIELPQHEEKEIQPTTAFPENKTSETFQYSKEQKPSILIIDDQKEIRSLIRSILEDNYEIQEAGNGEEALNNLNNTIPNLIVCDIIMPKMNGIEFISQIKASPKTQFIPIIMLSSKSNLENHISVLETGASMFISKPFHPRYLKAAVDRILKNDSLMKTYSESPEAYKERFNNNIISKEDKEFINKVIELIGQNFSDESYNQDRLANDLIISRVQLYRKIKQITQGTPGDFIRNYRLTQAEHMLLHTEKTVSEIIIECGFHNKAYFYREFSKRYNCSPKDFRNKQEQSNATE